MAGFSPFEVSAPHIIYVGLGAFICIFSYLSLFIKERLYLGEAPIAAAFGIIVGPIAIDLFNPAKWGGESGETPGGHITDEVTLEVMRVTIALSVFAIGVELPKKYLLRHWRSIAILLGPVMLWGWLVSGLFIWAFIPGLDYLTALVVAACVSPTDPILAQAVVGGPWADKHVPAHVRHMLMCESGCNDGAAFPFLYLALYLTQNRGNVGYAIGHWFYETWAYEIILGTLLGALIGYGARKFMRFSERRKLIDRESFVAQYISLAIVSMGVNVLLGSDDLLAAFACGTAFAWDGWFTKQTEDSNFSNIIDLLFNIATFIYIGALIPWHDFANAEIGLSVWRLIVITVLVLLLKRLPVILALWKWMPDVKTFREAVFVGHFGPIGCGAIFIATLGRTLMPEEVPETPGSVNEVLANVIQPIVYFFVLCSIIVHGLTIPFFAFGKNAHRRAHTLTRTWSRNPSMAAEEPGWMSRVRRVRTGEDIIINADDISAEKMSAAQLAMIGRGAIGGPIEDELRRETSDESTADGGGEGDSSSGRTAGGGSFGAGLLNRTTERDLEKAEGSVAGGGASIGGPADDGDDGDVDVEERRRLQRQAEMDGIEDWDDDEHFDPASDYLGDNCAEMKRYRAQLAAKREAKRAMQRRQSSSMAAPTQQQQQQQRSRDELEEQDLGEAPMDRDLISGRIGPADEDELCRQDREGQAHFYHDDVASARRGQQAAGAQRQGGSGDSEDSEDGKWPRLRDWVEGKQLVLEYQESYSDDPKVQTIKLTDDEAESLAEAESPAHQWLQRNKAEVGEILGSEKHHQWSPAESAHRLMEHGVPKFWSKRRRGSTGGASVQSGRDEGGQAPCKTLDDIHDRVDQRREGRERDADVQPQQRRYVAATEPEAESPAERDERAALLFGAMTWARDNRDHDEPTAAVAAPSRGKMASVEEADEPPSTPLGRGDAVPRMETLRDPSTSRRSSTSSGGGRGSSQQQQQHPPPAASHVSGGAHGSKRFSLRKKVLSGQIGLSGRRRRDKAAADDVDDEEEDESLADGSKTPTGSASVASAPAATGGMGAASRPTVVISAPLDGPSLSSTSPVRERRAFRKVGQCPSTCSPDGGGGDADGGKDKAKARSPAKEKFFPRSSSAGAGLSEHDRSLRSVARTDTDDSGRLSVRSAVAPSAGSSTTSTTSTTTTTTTRTTASGRAHNRHSSIQWLDVADGTHDHRPLRHNSDDSAGAGETRRTRTHSSSTSFHNGATSSSSTVTDEVEQDGGGGGGGGGDLGNLAERGKNRLVNFFSTFTAPKGEGMGNPGPSSHPHLFSGHGGDDDDDDGDGDGDADGDGDRPLERGPAGHEVRHANSAPPPGSSGSGGGGGGGLRVMIDMPGDDDPPVPAGSRS